MRGIVGEKAGERGRLSRTNPWKIIGKVLNRKRTGGQLETGESGHRKFDSETVRSYSKCFI